MGWSVETFLKGWWFWKCLPVGWVRYSPTHPPSRGGNSWEVGTLDWAALPCLVILGVEIRVILCTVECQEQCLNALWDCAICKVVSAFSNGGCYLLIGATNLLHLFFFQACWFHSPRPHGHLQHHSVLSVKSTFLSMHMSRSWTGLS